MDDDGLLYKADALLARYRDVGVADVPTLTEVVELPDDAQPAVPAAPDDELATRLKDLRRRMEQRIEEALRSHARYLGDELRTALDEEISSLRADFTPRP